MAGKGFQIGDKAVRLYIIRFVYFTTQWSRLYIPLKNVQMYFELKPLWPVDFDQALAGSVRECLHTSQVAHQATLQQLGTWLFTDSFIM